MYKDREFNQFVRSGPDRNRSTLLFMTHDFAHLVADESWVGSVSGWVREQAARRSMVLTGPMHIIRVRPWSAHLTVESSEGTLWFKANCPAMAFEPPLQVELALVAPDSVQTPLGIDSKRGWMLTLDHGDPLEDRAANELQTWLDMLLEIIEIQQRCMPHRTRLLATGLPDCAPGSVVDRFDRLVVLLSALPEAHPSKLSESDRLQLSEARSSIAEAAEILLDGPLGSSWQHGDAHMRNVFRVRDKVRVFDFGDSQWAHVLESLVVPYSIVSEEHPDWWRQISEVCAGQWGVSRGEFNESWTAARRTQAVNRASTWHAVSEDISAESWAQWAPHAREHLMRSVHV